MGLFSSSTMLSVSLCACALLWSAALGSPAYPRAVSESQPAISSFVSTNSSAVQQSTTASSQSFTPTSVLSFTTSPTPSASTGFVTGPASSSSSPSTTGSFTTNATTSSATSASPTQTANSSALSDIETIHIRRLPFIIASASSASSISTW